MANNTIQIKRTSVAGRAANTTTLTNPGELAINLADRIMYSSNGSFVFEIGANTTNSMVTNILTVGNSTVNNTINSTSYSGTANNSTFAYGKNENALNVNSAAQLTTARNIGDVSFNGTAAIVPQRILYRDTRATNYSPYTYPGITLHLKSNSTDGLSDGGTFHGVLDLARWVDTSGGVNHQIGLTDNGNIWIRYSSNSTTWTSWNQIITSTSGTANNSLNLNGVNASSYQLNSTLNANIASYLPLHTGVVNSSSLFANTITVGNSTVNSTINSTSYSGIANNSLRLGGTLAASFVQNTDSRTLSGNLNFTGANNNFTISTAIGNTVGSTSNNIILSNNYDGGNTHRLIFYGYRHTSGTTWQGVGTRIQSRVDVSDMSYLEFNPINYTSGAGLFASNGKGLTLTSGGIVGVDGYRVARVNYQEFLATGTWYNPVSNTSLNFPNNSLIIVELWGGGGSGARDDATAQNRSGGGGGGYKTERFIANSVTSTVTVTIGAGGAARTTNSAGVAGGNTTFGTYLTAYGGGGGTATGTNSNGGGGGGWTAAASGATGGAGTGATGDILFGGRTGASGSGAAGYYGGAAGAGASGANLGGNTVYSGAGGGARTGAGGTSIFGGNGGAGNGTSGSQPGGGGGSSGTTGNSGAGGDGMARIWTIEIF